MLPGVFSVGLDRASESLRCQANEYQSSTVMEESTTDARQVVSPTELYFSSSLKELGLISSHLANELSLRKDILHTLKKLASQFLNYFLFYPRLLIQLSSSIMVGIYSSEYLF